MVTRPWAQLWIVSTAGTDESVFLRERVDDGRARVEADERSGVAYFEWSAPDDADPDDPETWRAAMPALGTLIDLETIAPDHAAMDSGEFARAYLNRWSAGGVQCSPRRVGRVPRCRAPGSSQAPAFGVDVSPDRSHALDRGRGRAAATGGYTSSSSTADRGPTGSSRGSPSSSSGTCPVAVDARSRGPAGFARDRLSRAPARAAARPRDARQYAAACGALYDDVSTRPDRAPRTASARRRGRRGAAAERRRRVGHGLARSRASTRSPLIAATLARWGWSTAPRLDPTIY